MANPRGRPRVSPGELTEPITVNVPLSAYDYFASLALRRDVPLAVVVRERLLAAFPNDKSTAPPSSVTL